MLSLQDFVTQWASNDIRLPDNEHTSPSRQEYRLRPSRLGRTAYITAIEHLVHKHGLQHQAVNNVEVYGRTQDIFRTGHDVESRIIQIMRAANLESFEYQVPTSFDLHGYTIEGTADLVIGDTVIDVKTASASNFKRLLSGYNDLTYRTQLALYAHGLGLSNVSLLLYNKDTSELALRPIALTTEFSRVNGILAMLREMEDMTLEDSWLYVTNEFNITTPPNQMRDKSPTGKLLVPPDLWYETVVRNVLWETEKINGTVYVTSANTDPVDTIRNSFI